MSKTIQEHSVVQLSHNRIGTVVHIYYDGETHLAYLVEVDSPAHDMVTVTPAQIVGIIE